MEASAERRNAKIRGVTWGIFGEIGFVLALNWVCIGFVLGLFSHSLQLAIFSYSTVIKEVTFIRASRKLGLFCIKRADL